MRVTPQIGAAVYNSPKITKNKHKQYRAPHYDQM